MFQKAHWFVIVTIFIIALQGHAFGQNCSLSVDVRESSNQLQTVTAVVTPSNCSPLPQTMNLQSSDASIATVPASVQLSQGVFRPQISTRSVSECRPVTITYGVVITPRGSTTSISTTAQKVLTVCPFAFDPAVTAIGVVQAAAGAESTINVTVRNNGAETLFQNQLSMNLSIVENLTGLVRNTCGTGAGNTVNATNLQFPPEIRAGQQGNVSARFRFPQAGGLTLRAQTSVGGEDGPSTNNSLTQAVTVPLPNPLVCEIQAVTGQADTFTFRGNWFRRFGTSETPTVTFGNGVAGTVQNVASPLQMTVQLPGYSCLASAANVIVANATGSTTRTGPALPGQLSITGTTRNELAGPANRAFDLTFQLANFRPNCNFTVTMVPKESLSGQPLAVGGSFNPAIVNFGPNQITVRLFHSAVLSIYTGKVITPYGTATTTVSIAPESNIPTNLSLQP
ncbi:MAG: hypothetical protein L0387_05020 [Acidobacteria bacterium]|nr:hypothetical protein [Acidobacteriota bacterium]